MWRQSDNVLNPPSTYFLSNSLAGLWAVTSGAEIVYIMFYADSELSSASSDQFLTPKVTSYASNTRLLSIRYSPTCECHYELGGGYLFNSCRTEESYVQDRSNSLAIDCVVKHDHMKAVTKGQPRGNGSVSCPLFHPAVSCSGLPSEPGGYI